MAKKFSAVAIILLVAMFVYAFSLILTGDNYVNSRTGSWGTVLADDDPPPPPPDTLPPPPDSTSQPPGEEHAWQESG